MQEGEPELGGLQVPHEDTSSISTPNPQSDSFSSFDAQPSRSQTPPAPTTTPPVLSTRPPIQHQTSAPITSRSPRSQLAPQTPPVSQPSSFGAGDILLPSSQPQKTKKWPIIIIIVVLLLAAVGIGAWMLIRPNNNGSQPSPQDSRVDELYNKYANYILFDDANINSIEEFNPTDTFSIDENYEDEEFLVNAQNLFNEFYEKFASSDLAKTTQISIQDTSEHYGFLIQRLKIEPIGEKLLNIYMESGREAAVEYINNFYNSSDKENQLITSLKDLDKNYALTELTEWEIYDNAGCRTGTQYDSVCISELPYNMLAEPALQLGNIESARNDLVTSSLNWIKTQCLEINSNFKNAASSAEENSLEKGEIDEK